MTLQRSLSLCIAFFVCLTLVACSGCVGLLANVLHAGMGNFVPARFEGLAGQKVAVICVSQSSSFGPSTAAEQIATAVEAYLRGNVEEVNIVPRQEIVDWMDRHDWNQIDYREVGQGVGAQVVVAIDLHNFSLYDGKTLFKGRADVELSVFDLTEGDDIVYHDEPPTIEWPVTGGRHVADASESEFRRQFVDLIGSKIARQFYPFDAAEDFGRDATLLGF